MKLSVMIPIAAVLLTILQQPPPATARSIPITASKTTVQTPARREANPADGSLGGAQDGPEVVKDIANELALANLSIPSYLKDLFINFTYPDGLRKNDKMSINTVRSYENTARSVASGCSFYKFQMKKREIEGELIIRAELRLLQKATLQTNHYDVNIYYILREKDLESPLKLTFTHIDATPGWKTFDITPIAKGWKQGWVNHGIQIKLTTDHHHLSCNGVFYKAEGEKDTEPLLVVFTHDYNSKFLEGLLKESKHSTTHITQRHHREIVVSHESCHLKKFTINPEALREGNWHLVIPSKPFNIGMCGGNCPRIPLRTLTDHAKIILQQYSYSNNLIAAKRCCVPTEFNRIPMLFINLKTSDVVFKWYDTAQVTKCGCVQ